MTREAQRRIFNRICQSWKLTDDECQGLLDSCETERSSIQHAIEVYRSLHIIFESEEQADAWIRKPNRSFGGKSALEMMLDNPERVHHYVKAFAVGNA